MVALTANCVRKAKTIVWLGALLLPLAACSSVSTGNKGSVWDTIDYQRAAYDNMYDNDAYYTPPPSVALCVDDDFNNCNPKRRGAR